MFVGYNRLAEDTGVEPILQQSKCCALPLGDTPVFIRHIPPIYCFTIKLSAQPKPSRIGFEPIVHNIRILIIDCCMCL